MTQWGKEDLYGKNTINNQHDICDNCKFGFAYKEHYKGFDVNLIYCTARGDDVDETDWCNQYVRK